MQLAPLNVLVEGADTYATNVGLYGRVYRLSFNDLMNLICCRQGREQKRLEARP